MTNIVSCQGVSKVFKDSVTDIKVLDKVTLSVKQGERIAIIGPSGSGKSTLLHLLGGLALPTEGSVSLFSHNWALQNERQRCELRNRHLGFIYQFHHLLPEFTAFENVAMPLLIAKEPIATIQPKVLKLLEAIGLKHRMHHKPAQLSGGERQRVAIARALIHSPECILADEPTGNLDTQTAEQVFELMLELNQVVRTALIIVTHDLSLAKRLDRCLNLRAGALVEC